MESAISLYYLSPVLITAWGMVFFHLSLMVLVTKNKVFPIMPMPPSSSCMGSCVS